MKFVLRSACRAQVQLISILCLLFVSHASLATSVLKGNFDSDQIPDALIIPEREYIELAYGLKGPVELDPKVWVHSSAQGLVQRSLSEFNLLEWQNDVLTSHVNSNDTTHQILLRSQNAAQAHRVFSCDLQFNSCQLQSSFTNAALADETVLVTSWTDKNGDGFSDVQFNQQGIEQNLNSDGAGNYTQVENRELVSALTGNASVSQLGQANYSIPINVPAGRGSVQPSLMLEYTGGLNAGVMGVGWSVAGLSSISVCSTAQAKSRAQEFQGLGIAKNLQEEHELCWGGQVLTSTTAVNAEGHDEFKTEIDSRIRILKVPESDGGYHFVARMPDGMQLTFGLDAKPNGSAMTQSWLLTKVADYFGNNYTVEYISANESNGAPYLPQFIRYAPGIEIEFVYKKIKDLNADAFVSASYFVGGASSNVKYLDSLNVKRNNLPVRSYIPEYSITASSKKLRMDTIKECGYDLSQQQYCGKPTRFSWQEAQSGFSAATNVNLPVGTDKRPLMADFNGDGYQDLAWLDNVTFSSGEWVIANGNSSGFDNPVNTGVTQGANIHASRSAQAISVGGERRGGILVPSTTMLKVTPERGDMVNAYEWSLLEFKLDSNGNYLSEATLRSPGYYSEGAVPIVGDFTGDGIDDFYLDNGDNTVEKGELFAIGLASPATPEQPYLRAGNFQKVNLGNPTMPTLVADLDGDGRDEIIQHYNSSGTGDRQLKLLVRSMQDVEVNGVTTGVRAAYALLDFSEDVHAGFNSTQINYSFADVNADGLVDMLVSGHQSGSTNGVSYMINQGKKIDYQAYNDIFFGGQLTRVKGFFEEHNVKVPLIHADFYREFITVDYNGDGLVDVIGKSVSDDKWYAVITKTIWDANQKKVLFRNDRQQETIGFTGFFDLSTDNLQGDYVRPFYMDVNKDGLGDLLYANGDNWVASFRQSTPPDLLSSIENAYGFTQTFAYTTLNDTTTYSIEKSNDIQYPYRHYRGAMNVVKTLASSNGIGGINTTQYKYKNMVHNLLTGSFSGFSEMEVTDPLGNRLITRYQQKYPYIGSLKSSESFSADGTLLERSNNQWNIDSNNFVFLSNSKVERFDLETGLASSAVKTSNQYDSFGNLTQQIIETGRSFNNGVLENKLKTVNQTNQVENLPQNWLLGFVTRSTTTFSDEDSATADKVVVMESTRYSHGSVPTLLPAATTEYPGLDIQNTSTFSYNQFGYPTNTQATAAGAPDRNLGSISYNADGMYPASTTNALGHTSSINAYDARFAVPLRSTDANGLISSAGFDPLGRPVYQKLPTGAESHTRFAYCDSTCPTNAVYQVSQRQTHKQSQLQGAPDTRAFYDKLGRAIAADTQSFDGRWSRVLTEYDAFGRVTRTSEPFFIGDTAHWTSFSRYDVLGRARRATTPDGGVTEFFFGYDLAAKRSVEVRTHNIKEPEGGSRRQSTTRRFDALGRLRESYDANNVVTEMRYNAQDLLNWTSVNQDAATVITSGYDVAGNKRNMDDPDTGAMSYRYNGYGELIEQTDAKQQVMSFAYDVLGRMVSRQDPEGTTAWTYDQGDHAKGLLNKVVYGDIEKTYQYNSLSLLSKQSTLIDGNKSFAFDYSYDAYARPTTTRYPNGLTVATEYNAQGYSSVVKNASTGQVYRQLNQTDARGNAIDETYIHQLGTLRAFEASTGRLQRILTQGRENKLVQDLSYRFDTQGNLYKRENKKGGLNITEHFRYDKLNRLKHAITTGLSVGERVVNYSYDPLGNILHKSDAGNYEYNAPDGRIHGVSKTTLDGVETRYEYDQNGNMTLSGNRSIDYTSFNKPSRIAVSQSLGLDGNVETTFKYGPDRERYYQSTTHKYRTLNKYTIEGIYEEITDSKNGELIQKSYIGDIVHTRTQTLGADGESYKVQVVLKDHLGSTDVVVDTAHDGEYELTYMAFSPFGQRRYGNWNDQDHVLKQIIEDQVINSTSQGFTGHEQLDATGYIHMGGRLYDPLLGRFTTPDIVVQAPSFSQSYNRYSYTWNNPLSYTDPSGYMGVALNDDQLASEFIPNGFSLPSSNTPNFGGPLSSGVNLFGADSESNSFTGRISFNINVTGGSSTRASNVRSQGSETDTSILDSGWELLQNAALPYTMQLGARGTEGSKLDFLSGYLKASFNTSVSMLGSLPQFSSLTSVFGLPQLSIDNEELLGASAYESGSALAGLFVGGRTVTATLQRFSQFGSGRLSLWRSAGVKCNCFVAGTLVLTKDGMTAIEDVEVGDVVASKDELTGEVDWKPVVQTFHNKGKVIVDVVIQGNEGKNESLGTTEEHPFYVDGKGWVEAAKLIPGDNVVTLSGALAEVKSVATRSEREDTFNFEVAEFHTYFVGDFGAFVHNICGPEYVFVNVKDPAAKLMAKKVGGVYSVKFPETRFGGREFDFYSDLYIGQSKPSNFKLGSSFRNQARATFEFAAEFGKTPYFHFEGPPHRDVLRSIERYSKEYGVEPIIDTTRLF